MDSTPVLTIACVLGASAECTPHMLIARLRSMPALELRARCEARILREHLFLSAERLEARALARLSYRALVDEMPTDLSAWVDDQVEQSVVELITEDLLLQAHLQPGRGYPEVASLLGLQPHDAPTACAQLNLLPLEMRRACERLFLGADTIAGCAAELGISSRELKERIETILITIHRLTADKTGAEPA